MNYVIVALVSFLIGFITELGYLYIRGRRILVPFISATSRNFTIAAVALSLVALMTIVNVQQSADKSAECDRQFREALKHNTDLTSEQRDITNRARDIAADQRVLLDQLFAQLPAALGDAQKVQILVSDYNSRAAQLSKDFDRLIAYRNSLDKSHKSYPEPACGR